MSDNGTKIKATNIYGVATGEHSTGIGTMYQAPRPPGIDEAALALAELQNSQLYSALSEAQRRILLQSIHEGEAELSSVKPDRSRLHITLSKVLSLVEQMSVSITANVLTGGSLNAHAHDLVVRLQSVISKLG